MPPRSQSSDPPQPQPGAGDGGPTEAAAFVASALVDLEQVSRRHRLDTLTYLLELAHLEADDIVGFRQERGDSSTTTPPIYCGISTIVSSG